MQNKRQNFIARISWSQDLKDSSCFLRRVLELGTLPHFEDCHHGMEILDMGPKTDSGITEISHQAPSLVKKIQ